MVMIRSGHVCCLASILVLGALIFLSGCTFWVKDPQGRIYRATVPDQEVITFLNQFAAGIEQLFSLLNTLNEPRLRSTLVKANASFQELNRNMGRNRPSHPADLSDLHEKTITLVEEVERKLEAERVSYRRDRLQQALVEATYLQSLIESFFSRVPRPKVVEDP